MTGRWGFSLIELVVALAVGGLAVSGGALLLNGLADRAGRLRSVGESADAGANAERVLSAWLRNVDLGPDRAPAVRGDTGRAVVATWCERPVPWLVPCVVRLEVQTLGTGGRLELVTGDGSDTLRVTVASGRSVGLRYWRQGAGGAWQSAWSELTPPAVVGVVADGDTLLFPVGAR